MRFGREYAEPVLTLAERSGFLGKRLKDRRKMRDSRLYRLLDPVPEESLLYLWFAGDALARERVQRFVGVLSRIKPAVSGEDLIEMGLTPSPAFSGILAQALDARLDGKAVGRAAEMANLGRLVSRAGLAAPSPRQGR